LPNQRSIPDCVFSAESEVYSRRSTCNKNTAQVFANMSKY
jgi:hypothetical protein